MRRNNVGGPYAQNLYRAQGYTEGLIGLNESHHRRVVCPHPAVYETLGVNAAEARKERGSGCRRQRDFPGRNLEIPLQSLMVRSPKDIDVILAEVVGGNNEPLAACAEEFFSVATS